METLHELLVPEHMRSDLKQVGVMGGISMTVRKRSYNYSWH